MIGRQEFFKNLEKARNSTAYRGYLLVRDKILAMLENTPAEENTPSAYWREELAGFEYLFDASPLIIQKLRHHCYHISGLRDYDYRAHHGHQAHFFERKFHLLQKHDPKGALWVPESPELGGFGFRIGPDLYNLDTLRFYECLIALEKFGFLRPFRETGKEKKIVLEIGAGWGGFAYQFKTLFPRNTYVIVDFPASLLFSATYLLALFPQARALFIEGTHGSCSVPNIADYDFVFVPHFAWERLAFTQPDLALNTVSFQEMTAEQADRYVKKIAEWGIPRLYSMNRDRSRHNKELGTVSSVLEKYYTLEEVRVLEIQASRLPKNFVKYYLQPLKRFFIRYVGWPKHKAHFDYRHLAGRLR